MSNLVLYLKEKARDDFTYNFEHMVLLCSLADLVSPCSPGWGHTYRSPASVSGLVSQVWAPAPAPTCTYLLNLLWVFLRWGLAAESWLASNQKTSRLGLTCVRNTGVAPHSARDPPFSMCRTVLWTTGSVLGDSSESPSSHIQIV